MRKSDSSNNEKIITNDNADNIEGLSQAISDFYVATAKSAISEVLASKNEVKKLLDSIG